VEWIHVATIWMVLENQALNLQTENLTHLTKNNLRFLLVASCNRYRVSKHETQHETSRMNETKNIKDTDRHEHVIRATSDQDRRRSGMAWHMNVYGVSRREMMLMGTTYHAA